jgi:transposase
MRDRCLSPEVERAENLVNAARAHERAVRKAAAQWLPRAVSGSLRELATFICVADAHDDAVLRLSGSLKHEARMIETT